jgi:hypothetical protein
MWLVMGNMAYLENLFYTVERLYNGAKNFAKYDGKIITKAMINEGFKQ